MSVCLREISFKIPPTGSDRDVQPNSQLLAVLGGEMSIWRQRQVLQRDADMDRWTLNDPIYLSALDTEWEIMIRFIETSRFSRIVRFRRDQLSTTDMQQEISTTNSTMSFRVDKFHSPDLSPPKPANEGVIHLLLENHIHAVRFGQIVNDTSILRESILSLPDQHPDKALFLNVLGQIWQRNHFLSEDREHIGIAVNLMQEALDYRLEEDPLGPFYAFHLAEALRFHNPKFEDPIDLDRCISAFEDALQLVGYRHSRRFIWLEYLSSQYHTRYIQRRNVDDLSSAISSLDQAVKAIPEHHTNRAKMLTDLGEMLDDRFERLGDPADLNRSIEVLEVACTLSPPWELTDTSYYVEPSVKLDILGVSLFHRAATFGGLDDLLRSISLFRKAIESSADDQKLKALHNIARAKSLLFEQNNDIQHLNQAIESLEEAEMLPTSNPVIKSNLRTTLGHLLRLRFSRDHDTLDINRSISLLERVISDAADNNEAATYAKIQLAGSLVRRFDRSRDPQDLESSISMYGNLLERIPDDNPSKSRLRSAYAAALLERHDYQYKMNLLNKDDSNIDVKEASHQYYLASVSETGPSTVRFRASFLCANFSRTSDEETNDWILSGYGNAIKIIPELAWLGLSVSDRHHNLLRAQSIVRDAASVAIEQFEYAKALEWLEEGRSVIWGQLLQLRSPMDKLKAEEHDLAEQFMVLSRQLQGVQWSETGDSLLTEQSLETKHDIDYHALALQRKNLIEKIQQLPGFENFLSPRSYSQLERVARCGPVIVLNTSGVSCDALIVTSGGLRHIPLTNFTEKDAIKLYDTLRLLLINNQRSILPDRAAKRIPDLVSSGDSNAIFKHILSILWLRVVRPVVEDLALVAPPSGPVRRIWWCLTGRLAFLPIHAAGIYDENAPLGSKLSDFAVSSYTPTLTALLNCHEKQPVREPQMLVVAQPSVPGFSTLPGTREEAERIKQCIKTSGLPLLSLVDETEEEVIKRMEQSSWVHFACHGIQDSVHPTKSALILKGGVRLTLSKISQLSLARAELAFLSACQTATGDDIMSEEAVHLAAGMLLAGYRGVIATMWSIMDNEAPQVASEVYQKFFDDPEPDFSRAAYFLHTAVQKLHAEGKSFLSWVPFVHYGF